MGAAITRRDSEQRYLDTLQRLLAIPAADVNVALSEASDLIAAALRADKVDAFLYVPERDSLQVAGVSNQPLSAFQRKHGLDLLPLANGGRTVQAYLSGEQFHDNQVDQDADELRGIRDALGVRSQIVSPLLVGGNRRGVLLVVSQRPGSFSAADVRFMASAASWVGMVAHRAELVAEISRTAVEQGRRAVAEELVTVLAHDLRNQLYPIDLRLAGLGLRAEREGRDQDRADLEQARRGVGRLTAMVADMLDVARIDQGLFAIDVAPVDLGALIAEISGTMSTAAQPVEFRAAEPLIVPADAARVRQCMENLLANAIEHSPEGVAVTVRAERRKSARGEVVVVEFIDQGPGVAPEVLPRVFDRFVSQTQRKGDGGLGLGLYLARRIAVLHGGDLTVDSRAGQGARFTLTLPGLVV
jgi:signal transduction histidine kinase